MTSSLVIYEVIRVIDGKCLFLEDHLNRLYTSITLANKEIKKSRLEIQKVIYKIISSNSLIIGNIRLDVFFQESEVNLLCQIIPHQYPSLGDYSNGVRAITYYAERESPNIKILNLESRNKISELINSANAWEALLINNHNQITEGSKSNVFAIKGSTIVTPPTKAILAGITRMMVIKLCQVMSIHLVETNINYNEISQYNTFFITGTSLKILPLNKIDNSNFSVFCKILTDLTLAYDKMILQYIEKAKIPKF